MTKAQPRPGEARSDVVSAGSDRVARPAGPVNSIWGLGFGAVPVAAQSWMAEAMPATAPSDHAEVTVCGPTQAAARKEELPCRTRS
jgi:hypothetical protein